MARERETKKEYKQLEILKETSPFKRGEYSTVVETRNLARV